MLAGLMDVLGTRERAVPTVVGSERRRQLDGPVVRWGILSTARVNRHFLAAAAALPNVEVVAIASRSKGRAEAVASAQDIPRAYGRYSDILSDAEIDSLYVNVPNSMHEEWTERAVEAGLHVLCEKPLTASPHWAMALFKKAADRGLQVAEAFMYRYMPRIALIQSLLADGAIGTPRLFWASFRFPATHSENPRYSAELRGGALLDVGCYCINLSRLLMGEPLRAFAESELGPTGVDSYCTGVLRSSAGRISQFEAGIVLPPSSGVRVIGDEGEVWCPEPWRGQPSHLDLTSDGRSSTIPLAVSNPYVLQLDHVSQAILGEVDPLLGSNDAVPQAAALSAVRRSSASGASVRVKSEWQNGRQAGDSDNEQWK